MEPDIWTYLLYVISSKDLFILLYLSIYLYPILPFKIEVKDNYFTKQSKNLKSDLPTEQYTVSTEINYMATSVVERMA